MMQKQLIIILMLVTAIAKCSTSDNQNTDKDTLAAIPFPIVSAILPHAKPIISLNWSPDGSKIATTTSNDISRIWTKGVDGAYESGALKRISRSVHQREWEYDSSSLSTLLDDPSKRTFNFSIDTFRFLSQCPANNAWTMSWPCCNEIRCKYPNRSQFSLYGHQADVLFTAWHPAGTKLASGVKDGQVIIWDFENPSQFSSAQLIVLSLVYKASSSYKPEVTNRVSYAQEIRDGLNTAFPDTDDTQLTLIKTGLERQLDGIIAQGSPVDAQ